MYVEDLRRLVARYNLHLNIRRYSKMRKSDLLDQIAARGWVIDCDEKQRPILRFQKICSKVNGPQSCNVHSM